jgi:hypothetical protein
MNLQRSREQHDGRGDVMLSFDKNCIRCLEHDTCRKPVSRLAE